MTTGSDINFEKFYGMFQAVLYAQDRDNYNNIFDDYMDIKYLEIFDKHPEYNRNRLLVTDFSSMGLGITQDEYNDFIITMLDKLYKDFNVRENCPRYLFQSYLSLPFLYIKTLSKYIDFSDKNLDLRDGRSSISPRGFLRNVEVTEDFLLSLPNNFGGISYGYLLDNRIYSESFLIKLMDRFVAGSFGDTDYQHMLYCLKEQENVSDAFIEKFSKYFDQYDFWCNKFKYFSPSEDFILKNIDNISIEMMNLCLVVEPDDVEDPNGCRVELSRRFSDNFFLKVYDKLSIDVVIAFLKSGYISTEAIQEKCSNLPQFVWNQVYKKDS
jgi:hypothetical protein